MCAGCAGMFQPLSHRNGARTRVEAWVERGGRLPPRAQCTRGCIWAAAYRELTSREQSRPFSFGLTGSRAYRNLHRFKAVNDSIA
jgi:hypothetical protein